jgi:HD-GYP domain-containing protein (c-di-GMP phosphodiesterase class II)
MAVADVYDALTSTRSYREARPHEQALEVIRNEAGLEFDPAVVEAFERVIGQVVAEMAATGSGPLSQWQPVAKVISASEPIRTGGATQPLFLL